MKTALIDEGICQKRYQASRDEPDGGSAIFTATFNNPVKEKTQNDKQRSSHDRGTANRATIVR